MALPVITLVLTMAATLVSAKFWLMVAARAMALAAAEPAGDLPLSLAAYDTPMVTPLMITSLAAMAATGVKDRATEKSKVAAVAGVADAVITNAPELFVNWVPVKVMAAPLTVPAIAGLLVPSGSVNTAVAVVELVMVTLTEPALLIAVPVPVKLIAAVVPTVLGVTALAVYAIAEL